MDKKTKKISKSLKSLITRLRRLFKAGFAKDAIETMRKKMPALPKLSQAKEGKFKAADLAREAIKTMRQEMLTLFRVTQAKPKRFLVIGFNQAIVEMIHVELLPAGLRVLAYDVDRILPKHEKREEAVEDLIAGFLQEHSIPEREVIISISDGDAVAIHSLELPELPKGEILKAAKWKLKEDVPFDLETASIDWQFTREHTAEDGTKNNEFIFTIAEKEAIKRYLSSVYKCGLNPISITVGSFNYANILKRRLELPEVSAVLDIDYAFATLSMYIAGKLCFVRKLPVSWKMFTNALTKILVSEGGAVTLSVEEAEVMQNTIGIPLDENETEKKDIHKTNIMFLLRPALEALVRELKLSFNYFAMNFDIEKPAALFVINSGLGLKNLEQYLRKKLDMEVSYLTLPACVEMPISGEKGPDESDRNRISDSVGAALGGSQTINLLPSEIKAQRIESLEQVFLRLIGMTVGIIFLILILNARIQISGYQNRIKIAEVHLRVIGGIKVLKERLLLKEALMEKIQKGRVPAHGLLKVLGVLTPKTVILDEVFFDQTSHRLVLKGGVLASEETTGAVLASFMQQLESSPFFGEASLISSQRIAGSQKFEIKCDLVY